MDEKFVESSKVELKLKYTETIIKDIVAFLNSDGGIIYIGVKDEGTIVGVEKIDETLRKISDLITNQIEPNPQDFVFADLKFYDKKTLIEINISKGIENIYCIKKYGFSSQGCYIRLGSTCKEMTLRQIKERYEKRFYDNELILKASSSTKNLTFKTLKIYFQEKNLSLNDETFETNLNFRNQKGDYNLLAELLSDNNNIPIIFAKFQGLNKSCISQSNDYGHSCLIFSYEKILNRLQSENVCTIDTKVRPRKEKYLFDFDSVNEALINALVHNDWTITEPLISMFNDRIEILSHGGLPFGLTKEQFFQGVSKPRNKTLMRIFLTLGITEHTGHGIPTIIEKYGQKVFDITQTTVKCTIPFSLK